MKIGMNFGDYAVSILERFSPGFQNKEDGQFKDIYLKDVGLSKKERFKRKVKGTLAGYFTVLFFILGIAVAALVSVLILKTLTASSGQLLDGVIKIFVTVALGMLGFSFLLLVLIVAYLIFSKDE